MEIQHRGVDVVELGVHGGHCGREIGEKLGLIIHGGCLATTSEDDRGITTGQIGVECEEKIGGGSGGTALIPDCYDPSTISV
jgi:hypothetical protein